MSKKTEKVWKIFSPFDLPPPVICTHRRSVGLELEDQTPDERAVVGVRELDLGDVPRGGSRHDDDARRRRAGDGAAALFEPDELPRRGVDEALQVRDRSRRVVDGRRVGHQTSLPQDQGLGLALVELQARGGSLGGVERVGRVCDRSDGAAEGLDRRVLVRADPAADLRREALVAESEREPRRRRESGLFLFFRERESVFFFLRSRSAQREERGSRRPGGGGWGVKNSK